MLIAIILPKIEAGRPAACLSRAGKATAIETVAQTVLRGPFGGTIVAASTEHADAIQKTLSGYALQYAIAKKLDGPHALLAEALRHGQDFRQRWERARAAAAARFGGKPESKKSRGEDESKTDWSRHRKNADVKIRGLARSFDRDGVIIFRAEDSQLTPEIQAHLVESFCRESENPNPRAIAQAVFSGTRGYPVVLSLDAENEVAALPANTDFDAWLLKSLERVQDINV